jgi:5-methylcytosine-specific restriction endonuclease McrA
MPDSTLNKTCTKCRESKPLTDFNKQAKSPDGHHYYCRECQRATRPRYDPSKARPQVGRDASGWRAANKDRIRTYKAAYRSENRDKVKAYEGRYYSKNAERLRADGAERAKIWRESNPDKAKIKDDRRRAMKLEAFVEDVDLSVVIGIHGAVCIVCAADIDLSLMHPHPMSKSLEHVIPLARGGGHSYDNCAPSHLRCNISKGVKPLGEIAS